MPTAPVDIHSTELFYADRGPVLGSNDFTTLVVFHGSAFTGQTFYKLLSLGAKHNIRVVIVHRREYSSSTKYTEDELEDLKAGKKVFLESLGLQVINFLVWFAETNNIPQIGSSGKSGGLCVMGWSMGFVTTLAALGHPDAIPKESYDRLQPYFRQLIAYDPTHLGFGYPQPEKCYNPLTDPTLKTPAEVFTNFLTWISSYFNHPDLTTRSVAGLDCGKRTARPSIDGMTPADMQVDVDGPAAARTDFPMFFPPMQTTIRVQTERALFDAELAQRVLPGVEIVCLVCTASPWCGLWGLFETERLYKDCVARGEKVRPMRFVELDGANHFVHWDEPERFIASTAGIVHKL